MKYILNNPTEEQINALKKLGLFVYCTPEGIHYVDVPEIIEEELPKVDVVDLGLPSGLKWASCNIGANSPCESGLLFQFGRVDGYYYDDSSNKFRTKDQNKADTGNEYLTKTTSGKTYAIGAVLDPADDAAFVATDGKLRMPTKEEIDELISGTNNTWCQCNVLNGEHASHSVFGCLFTSKTNPDAKIFIPAAGYFDGHYRWFTDTGSAGDNDSGGYVWSSSVQGNNNADGGYCIKFNSKLDWMSNYCTRGYASTYEGYSVRGVCK